jgi:hypothetical protein
MPLSQMSSFDANLPGAAKAVRIASFYDAKIFVRRWVIRDKDPASENSPQRLRCRSTRSPDLNGETN